jgi:hypothetical protein
MISAKKSPRDRQMRDGGEMATEHVIKLKPKKQKILASVLHVMKAIPGCDQYKIGKTIFLADRHHLNIYGRPITFDNQSAMTWGPVPSFTYDMLKDGFDFKKHFKREEAPWRVKKTGTKKNISHFTATDEPDYAVLSESDVEVLDRIIEVVRPLGFSAIHDLAKDDRAYQEAWPRRGEKGSIPMKLELLLDDSNPEARAEVCMDVALAG